LAQNTTARATEAGEAALNFTLGKIKFDAALGMAATAETGVGAAAAAYTAISATGNFVSGTVQTIGAATGQTKLTEAGAEVVATTTSALGMGTFLATGNLNKAATAAAVEGIVTSSPKDLATGGTVARAAKAIDLMQNISSVWNSVKSYVVNPGPPTIPTPGLPPQ
jgi:hypothetical protein